MAISKWTIPLFVIAATLATQPARGHFVWITAEPNQEGAKLFAGFGEPGDWDEQFADRIQQTKYYVRDAAGDLKPVELTFDKKEGCYIGKCSQAAPIAVLGTCEYGIFQRGDAPAAMLRYFAKTLVGDPKYWGKTSGSDKLAIEVTPTLTKDQVELAVTTSKGKLEEGKIMAFGPKSSRLELQVKDGAAAWPLEGPGVYSLFVGHRIPEEGEADGKKYEGAMHYATLTFTIPGEATEAAASPAAKAEGVVELPTLPLLPEAVSSFGAAVADGYLYVYSGHTGGAHRHSLANLSKGFYRVKLTPGAEWEELPAGTPLQGLPMVSHGGKVYRIGGLVAKNATTEEDANLHSVSEFHRFDPETGKWTELAPLPEGRSSHDAVVIDDKIYVVGGWTLAGEDETWHTHSLVYDLAAEHGEWKKLPEQPFERRALTVGHYQGKLYAIGGMSSDGEVSLESDVLDLATGEWSKGPTLPEVPESVRGGMAGAPGINGFGATAWNLGGKLYVGTFSGQIFRISEDGSAWEEVANLAFPRFFHRLLPLDDHRLIAVGGASMAGHLRTIEVVDTSKLDQPTLSRWTVSAQVEADHSQGVMVQNGTVYLFGGNTSPGPHDFGPENFTAQALALDMATMTTKSLPKLPVPMQSSAVLTERVDRQSSRTILVGGMSNDGSGLKGRTQAAVLTSGGNEWNVVDNALPDGRTLFEVVKFEKKAYVFGGMLPGGDTEPVVDVLCWDTSKEIEFAKTDVKLPRSRRSFGGALVGTRYYMVGGINSDGPVAEVDVWNFKTQQWEQAPAPAAPRVFAQLIPFEGKLYLVGGFSPSDSEHFAPNKTIEVFDPTKGEWTTHSATIPDVGHGMKAFASSNRILFCGVNPKDNSVQVAFLNP